MFNIIKYTSCALVVIGAINWGLVGLFDFNLVSFFFDDYTIITRTIYTIIGISGIVSLITCIVTHKNQNQD